MSLARITISKAGMSLLQAAQFPVTPKSLEQQTVFQTLTGKSDMVTREDAKPLRKALSTQCSRMYSSEFYLGIYINILW